MKYLELEKLCSDEESATLINELLKEGRIYFANRFSKEGSELHISVNDIHLPPQYSLPLHLQPYVLGFENKGLEALYEYIQEHKTTA